LVNYDPVDKTVLANEQVDAKGCSWRSGAKVEKKRLKQWFFRISDFRDELLGDLEFLARDGAWPERVLAMQKNWLGKSTGARVRFPVIAYDQWTHSDIEAFTTRPDTLFGVQYIALASTHPVVQALAKTDVELQAFLDSMPALSPDSKVGYLLPHVRAINPLAYEDSTPDATKMSLPIYVAPYVLGDYGDGAVMGVPGHDTRDHAFWKHNRYNEPIRTVIAASEDESTVAMKNEPFVQEGYLTSHSGSYAGLSTAQASRKLIQLLESKNMGAAAEVWRLRDWLVSRQRYWGTPIPIIHCDMCGPVPVPEHQLPVELPAVGAHWAKGKAGNPLEHAHDWINTTCPTCHAPAKRDTDTMDTFVDSSWYFMRFIDSKNKNMLFSSAVADDALPVDIYIGGVEHAILHLLYARFISKFVASTPMWNSSNLGEPFKKVLTQGMVHGKTYSDPSTGRFLKPDEVDLRTPSRPVVVATGEPANVSFEKMSKSKYNGVDPGACMAKYGADATRAHILFQAPVSEVLEWDEEKISGVTRWLRRIYQHIRQNRLSWVDHSEQKSAYSAESHGAELEQVLKGFKMLDQTKQKPSVEVGEDKELSGESPAQSASEPESLPLEADKALWRVVQSTIESVTQSYSETFSLNTVVSDLMSLSNAIIEHGNLQPTSANTASALINKSATKTLIQMTAPITPAFAEECWALLHPSPPTSPISLLHQLQSLLNLLPRSHTHSPVPSIFTYPFPRPDGSFAWLGPATQPCAVQVNGKLKCVAQIPPPGARMVEEGLRVWIVERILESPEGKKVQERVDIAAARKVVVVKGGRTVNFVI
jgi:leucyl-tRNA synthetase